MNQDTEKESKKEVTAGEAASEESTTEAPSVEELKETLEDLVESNIGKLKESVISGLADSYQEKISAMVKEEVSKQLRRKNIHIKKSIEATSSYFDDFFKVNKSQLDS